MVHCKRYIKEKKEEGEMLNRIKRFIFKRDEDLENLAWIISIIDSYRVGMGVDMEGMRGRIRKLPPSLRVEKWDQVYNDMKVITDLPLQKEPRMKLYLNIFAFMRYLVKQAFLIVGVILFIFLLTMRMPFIKSSAQLQYIVYAILAVAWVVVSIRAVVRNKMKDFYYRHQKDYRKNEERLQKSAQDLIDKMGEALTQKGDDPRKYKFSMYQRDYKGITIVGSPGMLRDFFMVTVKKR
jgi:hypothetical protein